MSGQNGHKGYEVTKRILVAIAVLAAFVVGHNTNVYNGTNKGITVGSCGIELIGHPGLFCQTD